MHGLECSRDTEEQHHQPPFRELSVIDQIRIDGVLEIPSPVVREQYVDRLAAGIRLVVG